MKVAVTGANGFAGRHLMHALPFEKRALTRENTGDFEAVKDWAPYFETCDAVIHLAARVHKVSERQQEWEAYHAANTTLTKNIVQGAVRASVKNFIFMSSAAVYGSGREAPFKEDDAPDPQTAYGKSKLMAEELILKENIRSVIIRAPMIYGASCRANFLSLAKAVKFHLPLPLALVKNRRSLLGVENLNSFVIHALQNPELKGVYNISDGEDVSTPELVRRMAGVMNRRAVLYPFPPSIMMKAANIVGFRRQAEGLLGSFRLDTTKAENAGWRPAASLSDGLKHALSGF